MIRVLEGRWKLVILFQLFGSSIRRFSELERAIPGISQKMLIQQLRQLEADGVVTRIVHAEVPPRVEYHLTDWGRPFVQCWINCSPGQSPRQTRCGNDSSTPTP